MASTSIYDIGDQVYLEWEPEQAVFVDMEA